jgi:hypothetical protein
MPRHRPFALALGVAAAFATAASGESPIKPDKSDVPIVIREVLGTSAAGSTFVRKVGLSTSEAETKVQFSAGHLVLENDHGVRLDRSLVGLPGQLTLTKDRPQDVTVTIGPLSRPGKYRGAIRVWPDGRPNEAIELEVRLEALAPVSVKGPAAVTATVAASSWLDCLLPPRLRQSEITVVVKNDGPEDLQVAGADLTALGEQSGRTLSLKLDVKPDKPPTVPAFGSAQVAFPIDRSKSVTEVYKGECRVVLKRPGDRPSDLPTVVRADVTVGMQDGPCWPLAVLLFGVLMGRIARRLATPAAQMQLALYPRLRSLRDRAEAIDDPAARAAIETAIAAVEERIDQATDTQEMLAAALADIRKRIDALVAVQKARAEVENKLTADAQRPAKDELVQLLDAARSAAAAGKLEDATARLTEFRTRWDGLNVPGAEPTSAMIGAAAGRMSGASAGGPIRIGEAFWDRVADGLAALAGSQPVSARVVYRYLQPLTFITLLVGLVILGMQTLYARPGVPFGLNGVFDYLALFVWGVSAEVAQRTLQQLAPTPQPAPAPAQVPPVQPNPNPNPGPAPVPFPPVAPGPRTNLPPTAPPTIPTPPLPPIG